MVPDMASQVISGPSNPTYNNTTGQNVRVIINFLSNATSVSWGGASTTSQPFPSEIILAPNQRFSAESGPYNLVVIKEDGT